MTTIAKLPGKVRFVSYLVTTGRLGAVPSIIRHKLWSDTTSYGLRRDLTVPFLAPDAAIPIRVRVATDRDLEQIFRLDEPGLSREEIDLRRDRLVEYEKGARWCYVAVTDNDEPCFFQTVFTYEQRDALKQVHGKGLPELQPGQVIMEGALTPVRFRGKRIMPEAMVRITDLVTNGETREAITFVDLDNIPSLKGCVRSGYVPYCYRKNRWRFFRESAWYDPIPTTTVIPGIYAPAATANPDLDVPRITVYSSDARCTSVQSQSEAVANGWIQHTQ
jgi:hypothetical protein